MAWSYTAPSMDTGGWDGQGTSHWTNTWTVTELTPTQAGSIRLQVSLSTSYASYVRNGNEFPTFVYVWESNIEYGGTKVTVVPGNQEIYTGYHYTVTVQVPSAWSGKGVTFNIGGRSVTLTLGAAATYSLSITAGNKTTVTVSRDGSELTTDSVLSAGDVLVVTATATTGYDALITINSSTITSGESYTVSSNVSVVTTAAAKTYLLSISQGSNTTVVVNRTSSPYGGGAQGYLNDGEALYYGDRITIQYSANAGYTITAHTVNGTSFNSGTIYTVSESIAVVTAAIVNKYQLTRYVDAHLTLSITRLSSPLGGGATGEIAESETELFHGDVVRIEAVPSSGYGVESLTVNSDSVTNPYTPYTVVSAVNIAAIAKALGFVHIDSGASIDRYKILIDSGSALEQYRAMIDTGSEIIPY